MKIEIEVTDKQVASLLASGFEGGCGYWACIVGYRKPREVIAHLDKNVYNHVDYPLSPSGAVIVEETSEKRGVEGPHHTLNRTAIRRGLQLFPTVAPKHFADWIAGREDSTTGDVFIQLCLLGEVRYG